VTVAAIIERDGQFLMVEETTPDGIVYNQPAGHLEPGESLITAVIREVQEETAWQFEPQALVSVQLWRKHPDAPSFLRFSFTGFVHSQNPEQALDHGIIATHWLSRAEIAERNRQLRSLLVLQTVDEYLKGDRYPLSLIQSFIDQA